LALSSEVPICSALPTLLQNHPTAPIFHSSPPCLFCAPNFSAIIPLPQLTRRTPKRDIPPPPFFLNSELLAPNLCSRPASSTIYSSFRHSFAYLLRAKDPASLQMLLSVFRGPPNPMNKSNGYASPPPFFTTSLFGFVASPPVAELFVPVLLSWSFHRQP